MVLFIIIIIIAAVVYFMVNKNMIKSHEETQRELAAKLTGNNDNSTDDLIESLRIETARIEAYIQAEMVGDKKTVETIKSETYDGPLPEKRNDGGWLSIYDNLRILKIAGINHRSGIIRYRGRIESILVPEPTNKYDPDAIMVLCKDDRHHLGYIPSDMTDFVRSMANDMFPMDCISMITEEEDDMDGHRFFIGFVYIVRRE